MSKFGDLISSSEYVLFSFYSSENNQSVLNEDLNAIAEALKNRAKVIKIDTEKNKKLTEALRISNFPTYVLYKDEEMIWRDSNTQKADEIMHSIQQYFQE
ncbi:thioredoxin family protein [Mesonia sp.]|uniref:thioredoxin family protein n=1 Tax=Mesonia sp. TaxID=1960830 RepID=UPI00176A422E|nr:thioredoxin family protein [Mesonia sp.]HIB36479.1 thioredoxin [Mesonia sp.]HIO27966.1 thioredoxin [Flavobacteriaceae bacterium]